MSNQIPTYFSSKGLLPRLALYAFVLIVAAFFPSGIPGIGLFNSPESEAPLDLDESCKEDAISHQVRTRVERKLPGLPLLVPMRDGQNPSSGTDIIPRPGHRLANNLMAPLRC